MSSGADLMPVRWVALSQDRQSWYREHTPSAFRDPSGGFSVPVVRGVIRL